MNDSMTDLFEEPSMEDLFKEAFDDLEKCQASLDRCDGAAKASTPAAQTKARGLVPQGEGGNEVRVHGDRSSPDLSLPPLSQWGCIRELTQARSQDESTSRLVQM